MATVPSLAELRARRTRDCRLGPQHRLAGLDDADGFVRDRGIVTQVRDSSLPSLAAATGDPDGQARAFGTALGAMGHVQPVKVLKGRVALLSSDAAAVIDPLCRDALDRAADGELGPDAAAIVARLGATGPRSADELRADLGLEARAFRTARERLESEGALVSRPAPASEGALRPSRIARWDQSFTHRRKAPVAVALDELVLLGIRASVVVQEDEPRTWFTWPVPRDTIRRLLENRRLVRPAAGWVAAADMPSG